MCSPQKQLFINFNQAQNGGIYHATIVTKCVLKEMINIFVTIVQIFQGKQHLGKIIKLTNGIFVLFNFCTNQQINFAVVGIGYVLKLVITQQLLHAQYLMRKQKKLSAYLYQNYWIHLKEILKMCPKLYNNCMEKCLYFVSS